MRAVVGEICEGAPAELEREREAVARERERGKSACRVEIVRREAYGTREHAVRLDVVGRVAGLPGPLLVGETEQVEPTHVLRAAAQAGLQLRDERLRVAGREAGSELICLGGRLRTG